jgi:hypothetical protein
LQGRPLILDVVIHVGAGQQCARHFAHAAGAEAPMIHAALYDDEDRV